MKIKCISGFKNPAKDTAFFKEWVDRLASANQRIYKEFNLRTSIGNTHVYGLNTQNKTLESLVVFPGARTTALFWDLDRGLNNLGNNLRIFMVETNGLPNLSDGATPDIKSLDYGYWAAEVMDQLGIGSAYVAGASFGGLICMKLAIARPEKIKAAFLLNPGCLQTFSLSVKNLYYNLLPILSPSKKNVQKFLDKAIFSKPNHQLSQKAEELLVEYELFALTRYIDKTQKPYYMKDELAKVKVDTYLLEGDKDLLFPFQTSIANAKAYISTLKGVKIFENVGHGIETYPEAIKHIERIIVRSLKN